MRFTVPTALLFLATLVTAAPIPQLNDIIHGIKTIGQIDEIEGGLGDIVIGVEDLALEVDEI
jgi:hypothetical protein